MADTSSDAHRHVVDKISAMSAADVRAWLQERNANCHRHAANKTGRDRDGWLEDAAYFAAAIGLIDWTAAQNSGDHVA